MAQISIEIKNGDRILKAFRAAPTVFARELQMSVLRAAEFSTAEVKKVITTGEGMWKSPIDTGAMRRGMQVRQTGKLQATITPSRLTPYAVFVHEGTPYVKARPFFDITAKNHKNIINKFFHGEVNAIVKKILK